MAASAADVALAPRAPRGSAALRQWLGRLGPAVGPVLVIAVVALLSDSPARYLSPFNLRIVLSQTAIVAMGGIGMTIIIVSGGIDLSVGAVIALTGVIAAIGVAAAWAPIIALGAAVLHGGVTRLGESAI